MALHRAEDLRENAQTLVQQWDNIRYTRKQHKDFDLADGAKLEVGAKYSNAGSTFLLLTSLRMMRSRSTTELSFLLGYEYDDELDVSHEESVKFIVQTLGPMAFSLIDQVLADISARTQEEKIPFAIKDQVNFWGSFEELDPEEIKFTASVEPVDNAESLPAE